LKDEGFRQFKIRQTMGGRFKGPVGPSGLYVKNHSSWKTKGGKTSKEKKNYRFRKNAGFSAKAKKVSGVEESANSKEKKKIERGVQ